MREIESPTTSDLPHSRDSKWRLTRQIFETGEKLEQNVMNLKVPVSIRPCRDSLVN